MVPGGTYAMAGYIYDLAQLVHQQRLAPVALIGHSLGGNIATRYTGALSRAVSRSSPIEGLGPSPKVQAERAANSFAERMREWIDAQRGLAARLPRRYPSHRGCVRAHAGGEQASPPEQAQHLTRMA